MAEETRIPQGNKRQRSQMSAARTSRCPLPTTLMDDYLMTTPPHCPQLIGSRGRHPPRRQPITGLPGELSQSHCSRLRAVVSSGSVRIQGGCRTPKPGPLRKTRIIQLSRTLQRHWLRMQIPGPWPQAVWVGSCVLNQPLSVSATGGPWVTVRNPRGKRCRGCRD